MHTPDQGLVSAADNAPADSLAVRCELAGEILRLFGSLRFVATGWSMIPTIWPGDTLLVERVDSHQVRAGDVILILREGRLCAHRVISTAENSAIPNWITQGDALPCPDNPALETELLGRVARVIVGGKSIAVSRGLNLGKRLIAQIIRRSFFTARVLVYLRRLRFGSFQTTGEPVHSCPA